MIYLNKDKLTEELNKTPMVAQHIDCMDLFDAINNSIAENVTEVVRCKDCIHYRYYGLSEETVSECTIDHCENPDENFYCADGERR